MEQIQKHFINYLLIMDKISNKGFLSQVYITPEEINSSHNDLYFIYDGI
jgi:hypothetical protein